MSNQPTIALRPVGPEDDDLLLELYASTRAYEMALVPWTDEQRAAFINMQFTAQKTHYAQYYPTASHDVIMSDGRGVGRLYVGRLDDEIRIVDITILPAERNAGIGSYLLKQLLDEADSTGKVTRIYVETFNPSLKLFERLGFTPSQQDGVHLLLQRNPA